MATPVIPEKTKLRLRTEFGNGQKNPLMVLNELGYKENVHFRCEETDRNTGIGSVKTFYCKFVVNGCPPFPQGEGPSKKKAKERAASHVASHLLGLTVQGTTQPERHTTQPVTLTTQPVRRTTTVPARGLFSAGGRLATDSSKTAELRGEYRRGKKTAVSVLHEYANLKNLDKPRGEECPSPNATVMPFGFVWFIGNVRYPVGMGKSKQEAKQDAAKKAVDRLFVKTDAQPSPPSEKKNPVPQPKPQPPAPAPTLPPAPAPAPVPGPAPGPMPPPAGDDGYYPMKSHPRGYVLIINNVHFPGNDEPFRHGSDKDAKDLSTIFSYLGFKVIERKDLTGANMLAAIETFAQDKGHESVDCSVLVILSHGNNGCILGTDNEEVKVDIIIEKYHASKATALAGKPKLFLFQACRGGKEDYVVTDGAGGGLQMDATRRTQHYRLQTDHYTKMGRCIPEMADLLVCYSTNPGMAAYRQEGDGSIFIQTFCNVVTKNMGKLSMLEMLTHVNGAVSEFEGFKEKGKKTVKVKQISEFRCTLRKTWKL